MLPLLLRGITTASLDINNLAKKRLKNMIKLKQMLAISTMTLCLSACANFSGTSWVKPICVSKDDVLTDGTAQQIVTHDETLGKSCPNKV
jgi:hypothetical protein